MIAEQLSNPTERSEILAHKGLQLWDAVMRWSVEESSTHNALGRQAGCRTYSALGSTRPNDSLEKT